MQSILHIIGGDIGGGLQLKTRVQQDQVNHWLRIAEFEHPVASEHGEKVPGEEGNKGDEKEKVTNKATMVFGRSFNCHGKTTKLSEKITTKCTNPPLGKISDPIKKYPAFWVT